jgi:hypothetical protein
VPTFAKTLLAASLALLVTTGVALAGGNTLSVVSPGIEGNFRMRIVSDGVSSNQVWVQDNTPTCESTFNVEWQFETVGVNLDADDSATIMLIRQEVPADNTLRCIDREQVSSPSNNQVRCSVKLDTGQFRFIGQAGYNPNFDVTFKFELVKESAPGAGDGIARFYKNDVLQDERFDLTNSIPCWDSSRMGFTQPLNAATRPVGNFDFDSFISTR